MLVPDSDRRDLAANGYGVTIGGRITDAVRAPARIGADGLPTPLHGPAAARFEADRTMLRGCTGLTP